MSALSMLAGLVLLVLGGELLVRGASSLARTFGISPLVVGLTVVSFATSAPELAVTLQAVGNGSPDMAIGNVVGSNIANILLVLGTAAVIAPLMVHSRVVRQDIPVMIGMSILLLVFAYDLRISRVEAAVLFALLCLYVVRAVIASRRENAAGREVPLQGAPLVGQPPNPEAGLPPEPGSFAAEAATDRVAVLQEQPEAAGERPMHPALGALLVAVGVAMLVVGAQLLVAAAQEIARSLGISELVIGLTVVAVGTSLPELTTTIVAAVKGERDLAVGNAVGSNIFNIGAVLGLSGMLVAGGLPVPQSAVSFDLILVILSGLLLLPLAFTAFELSRFEGVLLVLAYLTYTLYLLLDSTGHDSLDSFTSLVMGVAAPVLLLILVLGLVQDLLKRRREQRSQGAALEG